MIDVKDAAILGHITVALEKVGRELDAADRVPGHDPWGAIVRQETRVRSLAAGLSGGFRLAHADLADRLRACRDLHLTWASLCDQIEQRTERNGGPGTAGLGSKG